MTTRPGGYPAQPPALTAGQRITVTLISRTEDHLRLLEDRTSLSRTDLTNRAITTYEFFDAQLRAGRDVLVRDNESGELQLVWLL